MNTTHPRRPSPVFREGQVLHAADLNEASQALREERWRHNRELHGFGIVTGLGLDWLSGQQVAGPLPREGLRLVLSPGLAIDPAGRELVVAQPREIGGGTERGEALAHLLDAAERTDLDLWLVYDESEQHLPDGTRMVERPRVHYTVAETGGTRDIAELCQRFGAVYLGTLGAFPSAADLAVAFALCPEVEPIGALAVLAALTNTTGPRTANDRLLRANTDRRVYVRMVADRIEAGSGLARVLLGPARLDDVRQFAVGVRARKENTFTNRLVLESDGRARMVGNVVLSPGKDQRGPVICVGRGRDGKGTTDGLVFSGGAPPPEGARPWRAYQAIVRNAQTKVVTDELRFEAYGPGKEGAPFTNRVSIGEYRSEGDSTWFEPVLTVAADGTVIVHDGTLLRVTGALIEKMGGKDGVPIPPLQLEVSFQVRLGNVVAAPSSGGIHLTLELEFRTNALGGLRHLHVLATATAEPGTGQPILLSFPNNLHVPPDTPLPATVATVVPANTTRVTFLVIATGTTADGREVSHAPVPKVQPLPVPSRNTP